MSTVSTSSAATEFRTTDLGVAAYLAAGNHLVLLRIESGDRGRADFVFADADKRGPRLAAAYFTRDALVPGARFHYELRALRRMLEQRRPSHAAVTAL
jgi:hypothetical protein